MSWWINVLVLLIVVYVPNHLSHSGLANIIVTNRCDLTCWYCFFYVKKGLEGAYLYEPSHEQVRAMMKTLKSERPIPGNSIQITGGEPMLRDDITSLIKIMKEEGVDHVQMNTNGIKASTVTGYNETD